MEKLAIVFTLVTAIIIGPSSLQANISFDANEFSKECPDKFVGKVVEVISLSTPLSSPSMRIEKERVVFSVVETERGTIKDRYYLDVLKNGPTVFEKEGIYDVELNKGFICEVARRE